ncbi:phage tail protein [Escherichia coli]|uniref:gp53-like domain-containing protein n=1 Tax=Escherichia coli TaxID=562 RepID=UPI0018A1390E|nr:phage tail protein [Escherichia coli]EHD2961189.1 phage tail protein [Escherichia coli]
MAKNDFKAFATGKNANVMSQEEWEALPALLSGFTAGKASSAQVNKVIRQASFIAAALAQYTANKSGLDVLDDGDLNGFITKMSSAFGKDYQALDATLTALAGLATGANKLPYFTGADKVAQTDLTKVGRDIIGKNTIDDILAYLGLGEAAKRNVGTGENQIPDMSSYASGSGWRKMPDGSIEQWGRISFPSEHGPVSANVSFPIPFTQTPGIVIVCDGGFGGGNMWGATNWSTTGFIAHCNYGLEGGAFFAKGW